MEKAAVLLAFANEHYAHARDHEHLRGQVTSILCAASFVLVGLAFDDGSDSASLFFAGILSIALGALNLRLNWLHENRFKAHVAAASFALAGVERSAPGEEGTPSLAECRKQFDAIKKGSLSQTWSFVPGVVIVAGICLILVAFMLGLG